MSDKVYRIYNLSQSIIPTIDTGEDQHQHIDVQEYKTPSRQTSRRKIGGDIVTRKTRANQLTAPVQ